jgi:hypothetical protein
MSTTSPSGGPIYSRLPAVFRTRDALQGGQLAALFSVLESQYGIVKDNLAQLYDDQFIETCAPWVVPYIGELIGYDPVYTVALSSADSRAEVANTIGYRRRKGTLLAMEQLTHDVSGRTTMVVEEFRRLITTLSLRDARPHHSATANLRRGKDWEGFSVQDGPFTQLNRTIDVRRIAPRVRMAQNPDPVPLDISLHGGGRFNIPDIAVWIWRWQSWPITNAPAFALGGGGYFFSALGGPLPLFLQPPPAPLPFTRLIDEGDAAQPVSCRQFARNIVGFYPNSFALIADGVLVDASQILSANLCERPNGGTCTVPSGKIAIDPERGHIRYAADVPLPNSLRVNYSYGAAAAMGGGPYDRTSSIAQPAASVTFAAQVGTAEYPTLESAVAAWNAQPAGAAGTILLPGYESYAIDVTGANAIQIASGSQLLIASAEVSSGSAPLFTRSCATLQGNIQVIGLPLPVLPNGLAAPLGQLQINGIRLAGEIGVLGDSFCLQITDSTLVPGRSFTRQGSPMFAGEPSVSGDATGAFLCLTRTISGPIALNASCSVRVAASILDATSPYCVAFAGADLASAGAALHIEDSTVIGRVWTQTMRLASNSIFYARLGRRDPWKAAVWAVRRQVGCVRFCWLPFYSLTPRRYECLPPDSTDEAALEPKFITLRFGEPGYCMLSGDVPLAIWKGASNGSQMGVYLQIQETEAVTNVQIRSQEYLPANLERGVFLIPPRTICGTVPADHVYGYGTRTGRCRGGTDATDDILSGIGIGLI